MSQQFAYAVPLDTVRQPAFAVLANFGLVAGRKPTRKELEELAHALREVVPVMTIVDEHRYEVGEDLEVLLEEVRIEVPDSVLSTTGADLLEVRTRVVEIAEAWVSRCAEDPGEHETLAERIARQAVVEPPGETPPA